ncbi:MAG TPA: TonB-dependent receptor [Bryobacteraceae bacterium]|nr:TonB-dependent receptor [Bryobacteraceae bacterium]
MTESERKSAALEEVVVTGTQIRGIAPAGVNVIGLGVQSIEETGASSGTELLANLPQVGNFFNSVPGIGGNAAVFSDRGAIARPNLRSLPNITTSNGALTLLIVDGHRMVPSGISAGAGVDPDSVPPSLVRRVEAMPDGASAIYGSDAVGGVINYITRDTYDGALGSAHYGFADGYESMDLAITAGTHWGSGNVFAALTGSSHDALLGRGRDYIQSTDWNPASASYLQGSSNLCQNPNISIGTRIYPLTAPGGTIQPFTTNNGAGNRCDTSDDTTFVPEQKNYGFMGGFSQDLTDSLRLSMRGWAQRRENTSNQGSFATLNTGVTVTSANRNYRSVAGVAGAPGGDAAATQTLRLNFAPIFGNAAQARETTIEWWQLTPTLTWDVNENWQVRALATYGESDSQGTTQTMNNSLVQTRVTSGLINPYNLAASAPGAFDGVVTETLRRGQWEFTNFRVIGDGPLFTLPGGAVRIAAGAERAVTDYRLNQPAPAPSPLNYKQVVDSVFGELQVPIVGEGNALPFVQSLLLSASVRHDRYDDFGDTTNPSIGLTFEPVGWLTLRGSWGTSFVAPNPIDQIGTNTINLEVLTNTAAAPLIVPPYVGAPPGGYTANTIGLVLNQGSIKDLQPQESENWSAGFEMQPLQGLTIGASYYSIRIDDLITFPGTTNTARNIITNYPSFVYQNGPAGLTPAQVAQYIAVTTGLNSSGQALYASSYAAGVANGTIPVAYVLDNRGRNLGTVWAEGIDFSARYSHDTGWGLWDASISGNHETDKRRQAGAGLVVQDLLAIDNPLWRWSTNAGATVGNLRAQVTWQHTASYDIDPGNATTAPFGTQSKVGAFDTFDLFFRYAFPGTGGMTKDLSLTLNVNNVLDEDPPLVRRAGLFPGLPNSEFNFGFTLGRFIQLGVSKRL